MTLSSLPAVPPGLTGVARSLPTDKSVGYSHGSLRDRRRGRQSLICDLRQAIDHQEVPLLITPSKKRSEVLAAAADARTRICVYGAASVIKSLAAFEKGGPVLDSPDSTTRFLELCNEMRSQNLGKAEAVAVYDLSLILFGR